MDFSGLSQTVTVGLVTYSLSIVDNQCSNNSILEFNQNNTAATVWLRAEVVGVENAPQTAEVGTMAMLGAGLLALGTMARRRRPVQLDPQLA